MSRSPLRSAAAIATLGLLLFPTIFGRGQFAQSPPGPYALTDLGTLGGLSAQAQHINDAGQAVGYATNAASQSRGFVWQDGVITALGTLGGSSSSAMAINNLGQVVGNAARSTTSTHAVLWNNGAITDLTPAAQYSTASGINDHGQVIGTMEHRQPFVWDNGVITDLPHLGGGGGFGADINNAGDAVGLSYTTLTNALGPLVHAVLWQNGSVVDLGILPGDEDSNAVAINEEGVIVGSSGRTDPETYEVNFRAFVHAGVMTPIPVPSAEAYAGDINDAGIVVGAMRANGGRSKYHAWIYADGVVTNLNSLLPAGSDLHLAFANGISNDGRIVGVALDAQYRYRAYLLTPIAASTPVLSIADASLTEGHGGTRTVSLTVSLSPPSSQQVTVSFATGGGSATSGLDYAAGSGLVTFAAGQTSRTVTAIVNGDRVGEPNETFNVTLSGASDGAVIGDGLGVVTITDDEPRLSISSVSKKEGNSGSTAYNFAVTLSAGSDAPVSVNFATADGSARAPDDFAATSGTLTFTAGQTSRTITVSVKGDRTPEWQEVFYVNLSGAAGAAIFSGQGTGVVTNDDR